MKIPNRADKQYTDIEKFKKYELTHCIAYEMAIRNDEVINTIDKFIMSFIKNDSQSDKCILSTFEFSDRTAYYSQKLMYFYINPLQLYLEYHFFQDINEVIKKRINYEELNDEECYKEIRENKDSGKHLIRHSIKRWLYKPRDKDYFSSSERKTEKLTYEFKHTSLYDLTQSIKYDPKTTVQSKRSSITPYYSRPFSPDEFKNKNSNFYLNLEAPTDELVDFIKQFKKEYDKDQTVVKNVFELLNTEVEETVKNINLPNIQNRYADMFFIYDCRKLGYTQQKIIIKIYNYYHDLNPISTTTAFTARRIQKYHEIAIKYIDSEEYKHLVT